MNTNGKIINLEKKNKNMHKIKMPWMKYANKLRKIEWRWKGMRSERNKVRKKGEKIEEIRI